MHIEEVRKLCGSWDGELGCLDENPEECPYSEECSEAEEINPAD